MPHKNPIMCSIFARGCLLFYRFKVRGESFPNLLIPQSFFKRFVLKALSSPTGHDGVNYAAAYAAHKRLHEKLGIFINKVPGSPPAPASSVRLGDSHNHLPADGARERLDPHSPLAFLAGAPPGAGAMSARA